MSRSVRVARPVPAAAGRAPLALERVVPLFVAGAVIVASLVPPTAFAGTRDWSLWRTPSSVVGPAASVTLFAANTGDDGGGEAVGCVIVTVPNTGFTVTGVTLDSVSDGDSWSADFVVGATTTLVRLYANSGGGERLHGDPSEWAQATVAFTTTGSDGTYTWTGEAYNKEDCTDAFGMPRSVTVTVNGAAPNTAPSATDDAYATTKNVALVQAAAGVLANDDDADGDPMTVALGSLPANGTLSLNPDGSFSYVPAAGFIGIDSFTYSASDGTLASNTATVTITVSNTVPAASDDAYATVLGLPISVNAPGVLGDDTDADGDLLTASLVTPPAHGSVSLDPDGGFVYSPDLLYLGSDSFVYRASDGTDFADATVFINVSNDPPGTTADGPYAVDEDDSLAVAAPGVLANDADPDGHSLQAVLVTDAAAGTLTLRSDGSFDYVPDPDAHGTDTFVYRASDGLAESADTVVTIAVAPLNDRPSAADDAHAVAEDAVLDVPAGGVLVNDVDVDGDTLTATVVAAPTHGSLVLDATGAFRYVPEPDFHGTDMYTYRAEDPTAEGDIATVTIVVDPVNDPPIAKPDAVSTGHATARVVDVVANDEDVDGDPLALDAVGTPTSGSAVIDGGSIRYTPVPGFVGVASVPYTVTDGVATDGGTLLVTVGPAPTPVPTPSPSVTPAPSTPEPSEPPSPAPSDAPTPSGTAIASPTDAPSAPATPAPVSSLPSPSPSPEASPVMPQPRPAPPAPRPTQPTAIAPLAAPQVTTAMPGANEGFANFAGLFQGFGDGFAWALPAAILGVPGLLFMIVVAVQVAGAAAWIPTIRRSLAGVGLGRRRRAAHGDR